MSVKAEAALRKAVALIDSIGSDLNAARTALAEALDAGTPEPAASPPAAYTTEQVARLLNLSRSTVAQMIGVGHLPSVKIGGSRRVLAADLERYLASLGVSS